MWCQKCQAEVAAMASSDNERVFCTACGSELARPASESSSRGSAEKASGRTLSDPRELLARWAREDALETLDSPSAPAREVSERRQILRFDASHPVVSAPPAAFVERTAAQHPPSAAVPPPPAERLPPAPRDIIVHQAHGPNPPHFQQAPVSLADKSSKWVTLAGQLFAYLGVAGLTVGTVLVLMGYFGGPASYATTGWLITTAGQMLLFLGVVTLVSGGMEQTTQEVARRIDTIGERLVRIEQATWTGKSEDPPELGEANK
ncbi:MAG: hypothetical protein ACM3U2_23860 [Deltaproteobacteria bacterium]